MLESLPPELFARVLEIAVETWGIGFLPPICMVSARCYQVIISTPSLWGILVIGKDSSGRILSTQLEKAKESDLRLTFTRAWNRRKPVLKVIIPNLAALVHTWVQVDMPTNALTGSTRWVDMGRVEALALHYHGMDQQAIDKFFESSQGFVPRNLHSFTATALPEEWVTKILNPRITYFEISHVGLSASTAQRYLSLVPNVLHRSFPARHFALSMGLQRNSTPIPSDQSSTPRHWGSYTSPCEHASACITHPVHPRLHSSHGIGILAMEPTGFRAIGLAKPRALPLSIRRRYTLPGHLAIPLTLPSSVSTSPTSVNWGIPPRRGATRIFSLPCLRLTVEALTGSARPSSICA
ncbi:hypothetical protein FB45DRAFT_355405 [Roridomyces roridus]|uniref:Uncharacterized protein n=1 Tax=Roridomyces roridus TaxID=1738132 RepID=A0AAD7C7C9_9AGAR|nr:hypothetical protein FB45DRAFT_355405 [Roridomyces roridus]